DRRRLGRVPPPCPTGAPAGGQACPPLRPLLGGGAPVGDEPPAAVPARSDRGDRGRRLPARPRILGRLADPAPLQHLRLLPGILRLRRARAALTPPASGTDRMFASPCHWASQGHTSRSTCATSTPNITLDRHPDLQRPSRGDSTSRRTRSRTGS